MLLPWSTPQSKKLSQELPAAWMQQPLGHVGEVHRVWKCFVTVTSFKLFWKQKDFLGERKKKIPEEIGALCELRSARWIQCFWEKNLDIFLFNMRVWS